MNRSPRFAVGRASGEGPHVELEELEAYVMGVLAGRDKQHLEAHVGRCARCAAALAAEADREMLLVRAWPQLVRPRPWTRRALSWLATWSGYRLRAWRVRATLAVRCLEASSTALPVAALAALVLTVTSAGIDVQRYPGLGEAAVLSRLVGASPGPGEPASGLGYPVLACLALEKSAMCQVGTLSDGVVDASDAQAAERLLRPGCTAATKRILGFSSSARRMSHSFSNSTRGRPSTSKTQVCRPGSSNRS